METELPRAVRSFLGALDENRTDCVILWFTPRGLARAAESRFTPPGDTHHEITITYGATDSNGTQVDVRARYSDHVTLTRMTWVLGADGWRIEDIEQRRDDTAGSTDITG